MFEKTLSDKLKVIFDATRARFDDPGDSAEQETLFIEVDKSQNRIGEGLARAKVTGKIFMFSPADKLPFAYFSKAIAAHPDETKDLFFYDFEENTRLYENVVKRAVSFIYFFSSQFDPPTGSITSITTEVSS